MKTFLFFALLVMSLVPSVQGQLVFKQSVNRLQGDVYLHQIVTGFQHKQEILLAPEMRGWVTRERVEKILTDHDVVIPHHAWKGPLKVWVDWCYPIDEQALSAEVTEKVRGELASRHLTLTRSITINEKVLPCKQYSKVNFVVTDVNLKSHNLASVTVEYPDVNGLKDTLNIHYSALVNAWKLRESARREQQISTLSMGRQVITWSGDEVIAGTPLDGYVASRNLKNGAFLRARDIKARRDIARGERIRVQVRHGQISIATKGIAVSSGNIGEQISIRVTGSHEVSKGTVVSKGVVNVSV